MRLQNYKQKDQALEKHKKFGLKNKKFKYEDDLFVKRPNSILGDLTKLARERLKYSKVYLTKNRTPKIKEINKPEDTSDKDKEDKCFKKKLNQKVESNNSSKRCYIITWTLKDIAKFRKKLMFLNIKYFTNKSLTKKKGHHKETNLEEIIHNSISKFNKTIKILKNCV